MLRKAVPGARKKEEEEEELLCCSAELGDEDRSVFFHERWC